MALRALYFDLDDTLHEFSRSSGAAMSDVYKYIVTKHKLDEDSLRTTYRAILARAEEAAFSDGRTSTEHRTERFTELLTTFGVDNVNTVQEAVDIYGNTLTEHMKLEERTKNLLGRLHNTLPLFLVTEGPSDAQKTAIQILGLEQYVTNTFISGEARKIKRTGELFTYALSQTKYSPEEVVLIGDSYKRDVVGGKAAGLYVVWLNRKDERHEGVQPDAQIATLDMLEETLQRLFGLDF